MKSASALALCAGLAAGLLGPCGAAGAAQKSARIGVLTDLSSLFSDVGGIGSRVAAEMAAEDSGLRDRGWTLDVVTADMQNKADVGAAIAREWYDRNKVDVIIDIPNSSVALAVNTVARETNRIFIGSGAATTELTNAQCSPNTIQWTYDTYNLAHGVGMALSKAGGDTWFFLTADYAFGTALERDTSEVVKAVGGKVLGSVRHPLNTSDFASFLLQAQASGAKVIGLANAAGDTTNSVLQAAEFGIADGGQRLAALLLFISNVHALGLGSAQGLMLTETFYWDLNDGTRAFSARFAERMPNGAKPTMVHAGVYASLRHYFKVLEELGGNPGDGAAVVAAMKERPTSDPLFGEGRIEPNGRKIHPTYLFQVKAPSESKGPWDYYKLIDVIPAERSFLPLEKSTCPLLAKKP